MPTQATEEQYIVARKAAWLSVLRQCLGNLDGEATEAAHARWIVERAEAVVALRLICEEHGDNDWPDDLSLADVIEKHLERHLV